MPQPMAVLQLAGIVALTVGACSAPHPGDRAAPVATVAATTASSAVATPSTPSTPATPADLLMAAATKTSAAAFRFTFGDGKKTHYPGVHDSHSDAVRLTQDLGNRTLTYVYIGDDLYLTGFRGAAKGRVQHYDLARFSATGALAILADPIVGLRAMSTASDVELTAPGTFRGRLDFTQVAPTHAGTKVFCNLMKARTTGRGIGVPFTAIIDGQGWLTLIDLELPWTGASHPVPLVLRLSRFGAAPAVKRPTGSAVIPATAANYRTLDGN